jgi:hypothetical protein
MLKNSTVNLSALCNLFAKTIVHPSLSSRFFIQPAVSKMPVSNSSRVSLPFFCKLHTSTNPTKTRTVCAKFKEFYLCNHSKSDMYSPELFSHNDRDFHLPKYWPFLLNQAAAGSKVPICLGCRGHTNSQLERPYAKWKRKNMRYKSFYRWFCHIMVKVKFTLEQAMKAQRESRRRALLFL